MKRKVIIIFSLLLLFCFNITAFAENTQIFAKNVSALPGENFSVPIEIKNNPGLMGFGVTVNFDSTVLISPSVSRGTVTQSGMFNDSISGNTKNCFDIIWNSTENINEDGTLFVLVFKCKETKDTETEITLDFRQQDTFNEKWEDVELTAKPIKIKIGETASYSQPSSVSKQPNNDDIQKAVETALNEVGVNSINDLDEAQYDEVVKLADKTLNLLTGNEETGFESIDDVKTKYSSAVSQNYVKKAIEAVDGDKIASIIKLAAEDCGADSPEKVPPEKQADFVRTVEEKLAEEAPDLGTVSDKLNEQTAFETILSLSEKNKVEVTSGVKIPEPKKTPKAANTSFIILAVAVIVLAAVVIALLKHKKRRV